MPCKEKEEWRKKRRAVGERIPRLPRRPSCSDSQPRRGASAERAGIGLGFEATGLLPGCCWWSDPKSVQTSDVKLEGVQRVERLLARDCLDWTHSFPSRVWSGDFPPPPTTTGPCSCSRDHLLRGITNLAPFVCPSCSRHGACLSVRSGKVMSFPTCLLPLQSPLKLRLAPSPASVSPSLRPLSAMITNCVPT